MREDEELAAELAAAQLVEEELAWKAEESRRRERLDEAEKKRRETEKAKGKKRKADEDDETDEGSGKKRKEVSNKYSIGNYILMKHSRLRRSRRPPFTWRSPASGAWPSRPPATRRHRVLAAGDAASARQSAVRLRLRRPERAEERKEKGWRGCHHRRGGDGVVEEVGGSVGEGSGGTGSDGESLPEDGRAGEGV